MTRWDPFGELLRMQRDMDRVFNRLGTPVEGQESQVAWLPRVDVKRSGKDMVVRAELPGVKREDVDVSVEENMLTIKGERKEEKKKEDEGWMIQETSYGSFQRSIMLPEGATSENIKAEFKDGVLEITVPGVMAETKPRAKKIEIAG